MMAVRRFPNSNGLQFYNLANGTFVSSIDYRFQLYTTSGAHFGYKYQAGAFTYRSTSIFALKCALDSYVNVHIHSPSCVAKIIGIPTYDHPNIYTVTFKDGLITEYTDNMLTSALEISPIKEQPLLPFWIKGGANATLFFNHMSKPRHCVLSLSETNDWYFYPESQRKEYYYQI
jgi:hypothetical protein